MPEHHLLRKITCPHCWQTFVPAKILWVSASPELLGDFRLGKKEQQRFLPSRFDAQGNAVDRKGASCHELACPFCHLVIPRSLLENPTYFVSIVGAPASGKSFFLASMIWRLRKVFFQYFLTDFVDAEPQMNLSLNEYESPQIPGDEDRIIKITKTEVRGSLHHTILVDGQQITYPHPFLFSLTLLPGHVNESNADKFAMSLCFYDNAGDSFLPSLAGDRHRLTVTDHLAKSNCIFFLYDPLQDKRFRMLCEEGSDDPQLNPDYPEATRCSPVRQELVLAEMIKRTRDSRLLPPERRIRFPLVIVVTKLDAWKHLLPESNLINPWHVAHNLPTSVLLLQSIREVSTVVRKLLLEQVPELVSLAEQFASDVIYIPVSATGGPPQKDPESGKFVFRSKDIAPTWTEVPMLYALARSTQGIIPSIE